MNNECFNGDMPTAFLVTSLFNRL